MAFQKSYEHRRATNKAAKTRAQNRALDRQTQALDQEIKRLECFIAAAPEMAHKRHLDSLNTVPPPDEYIPASSLMQGGRRTRFAHRRAQQQSHQHMGQCLIWVTVLSAVLYVLYQKLF